MAAPAYAAADYAEALKNLLPRGRVWAKDFGSVLSSVMLAIAPTYERSGARAAYLLVDAFPGQSVELLPEWESTLGLPSECTGPLATVQQRQLAVLAKWTATGGQSIAYFTAVALALGWEITVTEFAPFRADISHADDPLGDESSIFVWQVNAPLVTTIWFSADLSSADEPLASWGNAPLECELTAIKPAHTYLQFAYS